MTTETNTAEFTKLMHAFAAAVDECPNFVTDERAEAGRRTYKYLNLATILKAIKPVFAKHGIHFYQAVNRVDGGVDVVTTVFNDTASAVMSRYPVQFNADPQALGSAITYARRYSLYAILGIYPDKDDDGARARDYAAPAGGLTAMQVQQLNSLGLQANVNVAQVASGMFKRPVTSPQQLTLAEGQQLAKRLEEMMREPR